MSTPPVMKIVPPYTPELLPSVQEYVKDHLTGYNEPSVLELGSGWSTIWFAQMGCNVFSIEHDEGWWKEVGEVTMEARICEQEVGRVTCLRLHPPRFAEIIEGFHDESFRLVYVDCIDEVRVDCCFASLPKLKKGGLLVLDDTHWPLWDGVPERLEKKGFRVVGDFAGQHVRKDGATHFHRTSIYMKG